jgi:hypothetical protein
MRPANFPLIGLAQLAGLIHKSVHLFSFIKESHSLTTKKQLLNVTASDYWHDHYVFDEATNFKEKNTGMQMINNILINTVVPIVSGGGLFLQRRNEQKQGTAVAGTNSCRIKHHYQ